MVDMFCVLLPPGSGDELQGRTTRSFIITSLFSLSGIKKGIMELVELILITKADGELLTEVRRLQTEWSSALRLMRRRSAHWSPKVFPSLAIDLSSTLSSFSPRWCRFRPVRTRALIKHGHKCSLFVRRWLIRENWWLNGRNSYDSGCGTMSKIVSWTSFSPMRTFRRPFGRTNSGLFVEWSHHSLQQMPFSLYSPKEKPRKQTDERAQLSPVDRFFFLIKRKWFQRETILSSKQGEKVLDWIRFRKGHQRDDDDVSCQSTWNWSFSHVHVTECQSPFDRDSFKFGHYDSSRTLFCNIVIEMLPKSSTTHVMEYPN